MKIIDGPGLPGIRSPIPTKHDVEVPAGKPAAPVHHEYVDARYAGVPINLYGSVTVNPSSEQAINAIAFKNPNSGPMLINEIKFQMFGGTTGNTTQFAGGAIACKLDMGQIPLTNGFVPVWLFGRCENLIMESLNNNSGLYFRYRFPRPVFVPSGGAIVPTIRHTGIPGNFNITVGVSLAGKALAPSFSPSKVYLPYVAAFVSKFLDLSTVSTQTSAESDLINQFDTPFFVDRFTARCTQALPGGAQGDYAATGFAAVPEMINIRMRDSLGNPIVKDFSPIYTVVPGVERSWALNGDVQLPPKAYYSIDVQTASSAQLAALGLFGQLGFGMSGWREVSRK